MYSFSSYAAFRNLSEAQKSEKSECSTKQKMANLGLNWELINCWGAWIFINLEINREFWGKLLSEKRECEKSCIYAVQCLKYPFLLCAIYIVTILFITKTDFYLFTTEMDACVADEEKDNYNPDLVPHKGDYSGE